MIKNNCENFKSIDKYLKKMLHVKHEKTKVAENHH